MSSKIRRGVVATLAAGALSLSLAPTALAASIDTDSDGFIAVPSEEVMSAGIYRIADETRILTAIEASQSRNDWGNITTNTELVWECSVEGQYPDGEPVPGYYDEDGVWQYSYELGDYKYVGGWGGDGFFEGWTYGEYEGYGWGWMLGGEFMDNASFIEMYNYGWISGSTFGWWNGSGWVDMVRCDVVVGSVDTFGKMDIIVARADEYSDALAAAPMADVLDAPILLNPTAALDDDVRDEIARLAALATDAGLSDDGFDVHADAVTVHILGGTNALSHDVENAIDDIENVDLTIRYQGIDRYQTAVKIAEQTIDHYRLESGADGNDVNVYLTTGINFPDALAAGAAAANNDGVVLLTKGTVLDSRGFTDAFLTDLETWVIDELWDINTSEIFAVGGPSATAAADFDIRLADSYVGADRYETATITATEVFAGQDVDFFAVVSGEGFADALVASGFIANLDGPLLLTKATYLSDVTADYLEANVNNGDAVITFGGPDSLRLAVTDAIADLLEAKFAINPEIA